MHLYCNDQSTRFIAEGTSPPKKFIRKSNYRPVPTDMLWILTYVLAIAPLCELQCPVDYPHEENCQLQFSLNYKICQGNITFSKTSGYYDGRLYDTLKKAMLWVKKEWWTPPIPTARLIPYQTGNNTGANRRTQRAVDYGDYWYYDEDTHVYQKRKDTKTQKTAQVSTTTGFPFFKKTREFYLMVFIALSVILGLTLVMQFYLLLYLMRMRDSYILLSRSAFLEEYYEPMLGDADMDTESGTLKSEIGGDPVKSSLKQQKTGKSDELGNSLDDNVPSELRSKKEPSELQSGIM